MNLTHPQFVVLASLAYLSQNDNEVTQVETFAKKPFPRQPKPQHSFSAVFVSNIH